MSAPDRGEVWLVDLGFAAKTRPCVVISIMPTLQDRALVTVIPHTTSVRQTQYEVALPLRFLKHGAFDCQNPQTVVLAKCYRKLGTLNPPQFTAVESGIRAWLGL
jgi:mRNA interferase MazF